MKCSRPHSLVAGRGSCAHGAAIDPQQAVRVRKTPDERPRLRVHAISHKGACCWPAEGRPQKAPWHLPVRGAPLGPAVGWLFGRGAMAIGALPGPWPLKGVCNCIRPIISQKQKPMPQAPRQLELAQSSEWACPQGPGRPSDRGVSRLAGTGGRARAFAPRRWAIGAGMPTP